MMDLRPATQRIAAIVAALGDEQLALPTPCGHATVGDLVDHLGMFAANFVKIAGKQLDQTSSNPPPAFDADHLEHGWRDRLVRDLGALADAWSTEDAWQGKTWVAGMHLPAEIVGVIALDELVVHGWDLAVSTGREFDPPDHEVEAAMAFVSSFDAPRDGRLFGPPVEVAADATRFERLLGLTGRDPARSPDHAGVRIE